MPLARHGASAPTMGGHVLSIGALFDDCATTLHFNASLGEKLQQCRLTPQAFSWAGRHPRTSVSA